MIDNIENISRRKFLANVCKEDLKELELALGYDKHFLITRDWHVNYFVSKHHNQTVYGFQHSAIEYVFK